MKPFEERIEPFKDELGHYGHINIVGSIDYDPMHGPYFVYDYISGQGEHFKTYLDAMNECFKRFGNPIETISFRPDELLIGIKITNNP